MKTLRRGWLCILCLLFCLFLCNIAVAADETESEERQILRVGFVSEPPFAYKDDQGIYGGYASELLYNLAMRANFDLQFVDFPNYNEEDQALLDGSIDMEAMVETTAARRELYLFSNTPTITIPLTLNIREDDERYEFDNINAVNDMKIACIKNDAVSDVFIEWCQSHNFHPIILYYTDVNAAKEALFQGEADALPSANVTMAHTRALIYYSHANCYGMFNKDRAALMQRFDMALKQLLSENPLYSQQLYQTYVAPDSGNMSTITVAEKAFIANHPVITVAIPAYFPPFVYKGSNGQLTGILCDYYTQLGEKLGLTFTYKMYPTPTAAMEAAQQGQADILGLYGGDLQSAYTQGLRLINLFPSRNIVKISKFGNGEAKNAAILADDDLIKRELEKRNYHITTYENITDCYDALRNNEVDCIVCGEIITTWLFNNHRLAGYGSTPMTINSGLYIAVTNKTPTLYSLLNKGAMAMSPKFSGIASTNTLPQDTVSSLLDRMPLWGIFVFAFIMTALVILLVILILMLQHRYRDKASLARQEAENEKEKIRLEGLEKNAEEKNMFFSNISHDMRTPLNAILGYSRLAEKQANTTTLQDYLSKIILSGNLLLNLINDTLLVSKVSSNKLEIQAEAVTTEEINRVLIADIGTVAAEKNIQFVMDDSGLRARTILVDKLKLQKVLLNLLSNAVKFTPSGGHVWYTISDDPSGAPDPDLVFTVRDDGIGMSEKYQEKLFTPFSQEKRTGYESQGTGLGLSIVKQLVDLLDGSIQVHSVQDKGSTFTVRFHFPETAVNENEELPSVSTSVSRQYLADKRILLCEDNQLNADLATELMHEAKLSVDRAKDGQQGVDMFTAAAPGTYAAILMDLRMPVLNGYEATKKLRQLEREDAKTIPIIAMTADAFAEDIQKCLEAGMNDHLAKPIEPKVLFRILAAYIANNT